MSGVNFRGVQKKVNFRAKASIEQIKKWNIVRGDLVHVVSGRDKGKQGIVREVLRKKNSVLVEGLNLVRLLLNPVLLLTVLCHSVVSV
jgi:large subunit ribosomal protein L24